MPSEEMGQTGCPLGLKVEFLAKTTTVVVKDDPTIGSQPLGIV